MKKRKKKQSLTAALRQKVDAFFVWFFWLVQPIHLIIFVLCLCALIFTIRLYDLQVIRGSEYRVKVDNQYYSSQKTSSDIRGDIFFTSKDGEKVLAATQIPTYVLAVNPSRISDPVKTYNELIQYIDLDRESTISLLSRSGDPYEEIAKEVPKETADALRDSGINSIILVENRKRYYPGNELASEVIGFMSFAGKDLVGSYGLEKYYDDVLTRKNESNALSILGALLGRGSFGNEDDAENGHKLLSKEGSIVTTIEPTLQAFVEQELKSISQSYNSEYSIAIVMDPNTGAIYAMSSSEVVDLNKEKNHYRNHIVEDRLEVGSIIKPLTIAAAFESGNVDTDFSYDDKGSMQIGKYVVSNFDGKGRGPYTDLQEVLTNSLNTGLATIALGMDKKEFSDYFYDFGFAVETGVDLPGEVYGFVDSLDTRRDIEIATASFGQGIAFSPITAIRALATLPNGGNMVTPYIAHKIEYGDLIPTSVYRAPQGEKVFSEQTAKIVTNYLVNIVDDSETFSPYSDPNFSVALKTGTAEIAKPDGGYYSDRYLHSLMGYFPAYAEAGEPQFIILYMTMNPRNVRYSSTSLKNPFFNTVNFIKNYYNLKPDRTQQEILVI